MRNVVKDAAASGRHIRGLHLTFPAPTVIELLAGSYADFIYIDGEHGRFEWHDIETACITAELHHVSVIARVPDNSPGTITRFLDRGVTGIVVPHIEDAEGARRAVDACYYAPLGKRSFGGSRPRYLDIEDKAVHLRNSNETTSVCVMIETLSGLEKIEEIASVEGVDYLSFGLMDLSQSLGFPGDPAHRSVQAAVASATKRVHAAGKKVREDFMSIAWINELIVAGAKKLLPGLEAVQPKSR